jgi:hypothetical protein
LISGPIPGATPPALFCDGFFGDRISWTICLGWLWTVILVIPASWVSRITGLSHWHPANFGGFCSVLFCFGGGWDWGLNSALHLQSRHSTAWATPPVHFALVILEMGVSGIVCPGWSLTMILPILASQVAWATGAWFTHKILKAEM